MKHVKKEVTSSLLRTPGGFHFISELFLNLRVCSLIFLFFCFVHNFYGVAITDTTPLKWIVLSPLSLRRIIMFTVPVHPTTPIQSLRSFFPWTLFRLYMEIFRTLNALNECTATMCKREPSSVLASSCFYPARFHHRSVFIDMRHI